MIIKNMQFEVDLHIHTVVSGHSWSTLEDYVQQAVHIGMKGLCVTEHGPAVPNGPPEYTAHTQLMLPSEYKGIAIFKGLEADIIDYDGTLDVREKYLSDLEFCIASIHSDCMKIGNLAQNTNAMLSAMENPLIDMIGHSDDPRVPNDSIALVLSAKRLGKIIELNNSSLSPHRKNCAENTLRLANLCKLHDVRVSASSDSHWHGMLGQFGAVQAMLDEINFPPELIINLNLKGVQDYISERKHRLSKKELL